MLYTIYYTNKIKHLQQKRKKRAHKLKLLTTTTHPHATMSSTAADNHNKFIEQLVQEGVSMLRNDVRDAILSLHVVVKKSKALRDVASGAQVLSGYEAPSQLDEVFSEIDAVLNKSGPGVKAVYDLLKALDGFDAYISAELKDYMEMSAMERACMGDS